MKKITTALFILFLLALFLVPASADPPRENGEPPDYRSFLKIDVHTHIFADCPEYVRMLRRNNIRGINICTGGTDPEMLQAQQEAAEMMQASYPDTFAFASTFDLSARNQPDYHRQVDRWLTSCVESGALMIKIWKEIGMEIKDSEGEFIMPDDELFDPIYRRIGQLGQPLIAHLAEPVAAWRPLDPESPHYNYYSSHPEWHFYRKKGVPSWEEIIAARDRILEKHRSFDFIGAHLGSMAHDVDEVAERFDRFPHFYVDVSARTNDLTRQPRDKVRKFFIKYQDRIMYGVDQTLSPEQLAGMTDEERKAFVEAVEKKYRSHWDYYAGSGPVEVSGYVTEGLALPIEVLEKFYFRNARRIIPRLKF